MSNSSSNFRDRLSGRQVGQILAENPLRASVFEEYGIDYCCGGKLSIEDACRKRGLDPDILMEKLLAVGTESGHDSVDWSRTSLHELIEHIIKTYHLKLRSDLPRIAELAAKVARVHGENHPEMIELSSIFASFKDDLERHMQKEEMVLFPGISKMESGEEAFFACGGNIEHPIQVMTYEHEEAGRMLALMRKLCNDFNAPADACNSYRALFAMLAELEKDMHWHVHKENNILFPAAARLQEKGPSRRHCHHN